MPAFTRLLLSDVTALPSVKLKIAQDSGLARPAMTRFVNRVKPDARQVEAEAEAEAEAHPTLNLALTLALTLTLALALTLGLSLTLTPTLT